MHFCVVIIVKIECVDHHAQAQGDVRAGTAEIFQPQRGIAPSPLLLDETVHDAGPGLGVAVEAAADAVQKILFETRGQAGVKAVIFQVCGKVRQRLCRTFHGYDPRNICSRIPQDPLYRHQGRNAADGFHVIEGPKPVVERPRLVRRQKPRGAVFEFPP